MENILDLKGRVALVTGAGQGVGRQVALHFAAHNGGTVVVNDYHLDRAEIVAAEIRESGGMAVAAGCDVTDLAAVSAMVKEAERNFGAVDLLVNNAGNAGPTMGVSDLKPFWETEPDEWLEWFGTNLFGVLNCCRAVTPGMIERGYGRIVTVISDAGRVGEPHLAVYSGAKAGAAGFMRGLARALGRSSVTANCVALGTIDTPTIRELLPDDESLRKALRQYTIRRIGEPADAAGLILFLASDAASWITGQTYPVNGGYSFAV